MYERPAETGIFAPISRRCTAMPRSETRKLCEPGSQTSAAEQSKYNEPKLKRKALFVDLSLSGLVLVAAALSVAARLEFFL